MLSSLLSATRFELYDLLTIASLGCASALRAKLAGELSCGALLLGFFCALSWPFVRELLLRGSVLALFASVPHILAVLGGSLCGLFLGICVQKEERAMFYVEAFAQSLCCIVGFFLCLRHLPAHGALLACLFLAIVPNFVCDLALGDAARFVSQYWHISRSMLATVLACIVTLLLSSSLESPLPWDCIGVILAVVLTLLLEYIREGRKDFST